MPGSLVRRWTPVNLARLAYRRGGTVEWATRRPHPGPLPRGGEGEERPDMATHAITDVAIVLKPEDDVAIAKKEIPAGTILEDAGGRIEVRQDIKPGHKVARRAPAHRARRSAATGRPSASPPPTSRSAITSTPRTSRWATCQQRYEIGTDVQPVAFYPPAEMRYFDGYLREDGRVGTRNYVAVISGVNCSASVSQFVKDKFRDVQRRLPERRRRARHHPQVGLRHQALRRGPHGAAAGAGRLRQAPERRRLHPDRARLRGEPGRGHGRPAAHGRARPSASASPFVVNIQEAGGIRKTVEPRSARSAKLLPLRQRGAAHDAAGVRADRSPPTAAAPTATPASPPTPRSAGRWTSWCATAAPACSRRRRRSTAPSTC